MNAVGMKWSKVKMEVQLNSAAQMLVSNVIDKGIGISLTAEPFS
jgi:hypothetical protein